MSCRAGDFPSVTCLRIIFGNADDLCHSAHVRRGGIANREPETSSRWNIVLRYLKKNDQQREGTPENECIRNKVQSVELKRQNAMEKARRLSAELEVGIREESEECARVSICETGNLRMVHRSTRWEICGSKVAGTKRAPCTLAQRMPAAMALQPSALPREQAV